jgi:heat shock protein HtpX
MNLFLISKRVILFTLVNVLVMGTLTLLFRVTGLDAKFPPGSYQSLMIFCFVWGMGGAFISLALSRIMAKWMMRVRVIPPNTNDPALRDLVNTVHELARRANLPKLPEVGIYESAEINAFATGPTRSRSLVAVSTGLLQRMNRREVEGVLAHEVAHIANGDMVTMTLVQGVINAFVMFLARILAMVVMQALRSRDNDRGGYWMQFMLVQVFQIVLSLFGAIVVCWFSRYREFRADAGGAALSNRENMTGALRALQRVYEQHQHPELATGGAAFQSLKISGKTSTFARLFSTHPPLEQRIARLEASRGPN